jgi:TPR repeat protein
MKGLSLVARVAGFFSRVLSGTVWQEPQKTEKTQKEIIKAAPQSPTKETKEETLAEFAKAAEAGNPSAQNNLGGMYAHG